MKSTLSLLLRSNQILLYQEENFVDSSGTARSRVKYLFQMSASLFGTRYQDAYSL